MEIKNIVAEPNKVVDPSRGKVVISPNPIKVSERFDNNGNIINPVTKEIIRKAGEPQ